MPRSELIPGIAVTQETIVEPAGHAVIPAAAPKQEPREVNGDLNERGTYPTRCLALCCDEQLSSHYAIYALVDGF